MQRRRRKTKAEYELAHLVKMARDCIGTRNVISPQMVVGAYRKRYSNEQLETLVERFPSQEMLAGIGDSFMLVPYPPSEWDFRSVIRKNKRVFKQTFAWYLDYEQLRTEEEKLMLDGWLLVRKELLSGSRGCDPYTILPSSERLLTLTEAVYVIAVANKVFGWMLLREVFTWTDTHAQNGERVAVGNFDRRCGIDIQPFGQRSSHADTITAAI